MTYTETKEKGEKKTMMNQEEDTPKTQGVENSNVQNSQATAVTNGQVQQWEDYQQVPPLGSGCLQNRNRTKAETESQ